MCRSNASAHRWQLAWTSQHEDATAALRETLLSSHKSTKKLQNKRMKRPSVLCIQVSENGRQEILCIWWRVLVRESDIRQLQGQRTSLCRKPWAETHNDDLTVCHSSNKVTKNNHTCTQTQKPKANTRDKFKEKCKKKNSMTCTHTWHKHTYTSVQKTQQCRCESQFTLSHHFPTSCGRPMK